MKEQSGPSQSRRICPKCGSTKVASILYGMPAFNKKLERDLNTGRIVLGGCVVSGNDPQFHCLECESEWASSKAPKPGR